MYYTTRVNVITLRVGDNSMDFRNRGSQPPTTHNQSAGPAPSNSHPGNAGSAGKNSTVKRGLGAVLILAVLLIGAFTLVSLLGGSNQAKAVQGDKFQAVFLNNGQVYFGKIQNLGGDFIDLDNIYYLQTNGEGGEEAAASTNVSLVKLGCELHAPYDQMIINRDQVLFWENLKESSQVVKAIDEYKKQNPGEQKCSEQSQNSTNQAPATNSQGGGSTTPVTPAPAATGAPVRP